MDPTQPRLPHHDLGLLILLIDGVTSESIILQQSTIGGRICRNVDLQLANQPKTLNEGQMIKADGDLQSSMTGQNHAADNRDLHQNGALQPNDADDFLGKDPALDQYKDQASVNEDNNSADPEDSDGSKVPDYEDEVYDDNEPEPDANDDSSGNDEDDYPTDFAAENEAFDFKPQTNQYYDILRFPRQPESPHPRVKMKAQLFFLRLQKNLLDPGDNTLFFFIPLRGKNMLHGQWHEKVSDSQSGLFTLNYTVHIKKKKMKTLAFLLMAIQAHVDPG